MRPADGGSGLQRVALAQLAAEPALDLLVFGHSHAQSLDRASGGGVYGNPGAWLDGPTALRIDADVVELVSYDEAGTRTLKREHRRRS
jgi:predicted phosphodiesterase